MIRYSALESATQRKLGVVLGYVCTATQTLVSFAYTPLLLGGIGQSEYGLYQIIGSIAAYINILESMLTASAIRFYCQEKSEGNEDGMESVLAAARTLYRLFALVVIALAIVFGFVFQSAYHETMTEEEIQEGLIMLAIVSCSIVVNMMNYTYCVVIQANERFVFLKILELIGLILQPILVIALIGGWPQAVVISLVQLAITVVSCILKRLYAVGKLQCKIKAHGPVKSMAHAMLGFSSIMLVSMIADIVFAKTGQLVVGFLMSTSAVAVFSIGYQIYQAYASLGRMVSSVFVPHVTEISKADDANKRLSDLWSKTGRICSFILSAILIIFGFYGNEFLVLWVGEGYDEAYIVAMLMMLAFIPDIVQALGLTILQVIDRYAFRSAVYVASAVANIVLSVPLIMAFGVCGSALSSFIVLFLGSGVIMNFYYARVIKLDVGGFWKDILSTLRAIPVVAAACFAIKYISLSSAILTFLVHCAFAVLVWFIATYALVMNDSEKQLIRSFFIK